MLFRSHKVPLEAVVISFSQTITMNEFFTGTPSQICQISSTNSALNYTITFNDEFEKVAKFVAISGCTLSKRNQLLVLTNSRFNTSRSTNTLGIRYYNQMPNGFSKNEVFSTNARQSGLCGGLVGDPNFVKQG